MLWIGIDLVIAVGGLVVLALLTLRLWHQVRQFGRDVAAASERISAASDDLSRIAPHR